MGRNEYHSSAKGSVLAALVIYRAKKIYHEGPARCGVESGAVAGAGGLTAAIGNS